MGSNKEEKNASYPEEERSVAKTKAACFGSILVSVAGGVLLGWWEYRYHRSFRQLWMVPFGLILFATPMIVWLPLMVSHICNSKNDDNSTRASQTDSPLSNSAAVKKDEQ